MASSTTTTAQVTAVVFQLTRPPGRRTAARTAALAGRGLPGEGAGNGPADGTPFPGTPAGGLTGCGPADDAPLDTPFDTGPGGDSPSGRPSGDGLAGTVAPGPAVAGGTPGSRAVATALSSGAAAALVATQASSWPRSRRRRTMARKRALPRLCNFHKWKSPARRKLCVRRRHRQSWPGWRSEPKRAASGASTCLPGRRCTRAHAHSARVKRTDTGAISSNAAKP